MHVHEYGPPLIPLATPMGRNLGLLHNLPLNVRVPKLLSPPPWFTCRFHKSIADYPNLKRKFTVREIKY